MKKALITIIVIALAVLLIYRFTGKDNSLVETALPSIYPISHATFFMEWDDTIFYNDPVGGAEAFADKPIPNIILVSDIHGDHLSIETLEEIAVEGSTIIAPQAVFDQFTEGLKAQTVVVANGETIEQNGFSIEAIPMYNLPENEDSRHTKGRGNGYLIEKDATRVYIAGDTAGIPEMRALTDIDIAFVPMNLPFTMDVDEAADSVLDFTPNHVYPYHYRGQDGLADINRFKELVNTGNPTIDVVLLDWYPDNE